MAEEKLTWRTEQRKVRELIPSERNPRKLTDAQAKQLDASLEKFDLVEIPVINSDNTLIAGHMRVSRLMLKGRDEETIDVRVPSRKLTADEFDEYNIRSNKNTGEWDWEKLAEFEESLLAEVGFDAKDLDTIFNEDEHEDDFDAAAAAEAIINPVAKRGELYQLGNHRLICGDSANAADVDRLMGGVRADMVFTDPPYNVNYSGAGKRTSNTIENDNMSEEDFRRMLNSWFLQYARILKPDGALYTCYANRTQREFEDALNANGFEVRNQIIWVKTLAAWGFGDYRCKHEPILYAHQKGSPLTFHGDRKQVTAWDEEPTDADLIAEVRKMVKKDESGESTVWRISREQKYDHPTQKPIKLVSIAIGNSSKRNDVVADLFGGSGSTLMAAEQLNRRAYLCEIDPRYVDVIINRWERTTSKKAIKV